MSRVGAVRYFAKAAKAVSHAPPIKIFGIPGRYAEATYTAASKVPTVDRPTARMALSRQDIGRFCVEMCL